MAISEQINEDLKQAMRDKNKIKLEALRAVKTAFTLERTNKGTDAVLSEDEELKILQKLVKQRKDSASEYKAQNRADLAEKEEEEAGFIEEYLPEQLSEEEIEAKVKEVIAQTGASSMKEMGKVMGMASKQLAGKADNKIVSEIVKKLLS